MALPKRIMTSVLECQMRFLFEKRTKAYKWYVEGVSQKKIVAGAKNFWQGHALPGLERSGA